MNASKERTPGFGWYSMILIFLALFVGNFMNLGLGMLIPSIREDLGISLEVAGSFSGISFITQVIIAIPVAILSTRLKPKASIGLILICLTAACLLHLWTGYRNSRCDCPFDRLKRLEKRYAVSGRRCRDRDHCMVFIL